MKNVSVTVILVVAATALGFIATKNLKTSRTEKHLRACKNHLADMEGAKAQYALEHEGECVSFVEELVPQYLGVVPKCPSGGTYTFGDTQVLVSCTIEGHKLAW